MWLLNVVTVDEENVPHIMISYHHNSAQRTMIKVKNHLRAAGFKVWMDVDNMCKYLYQLLLIVSNVCFIMSLCSFWCSIKQVCAVMYVV